ncbi:MAG: D-amino acid aminotransferase [Proteobacteria bacterium]|nr:D-amino acid aminotransferase [Pseudomonadota bacterium]
MIYLNGAFMPLAEARIPVMDRGFLFGDGVYEVIPVYSRQPFRLAEHLQRLEHSLASIRLANPHGAAEWTELIGKIIAAAPSDDQQVYLQITRGADVRRNHAFPKSIVPTVFVMSETLLPPAAELRQLGARAISATDNRWLRCDIKSVSLLANCLLRQMAVEAGCDETLLFRDGFLSEGTASNIFVVRDGVLLAPQKNHLMLPGITYDVVLELAAAHGVKHEVRDVLEEEVRAADELWMSSSTREVLAIVSLDGSPIGNAKPGPLFTAMYDWYQEFKRTVMRGA